GGKAVGKFGPGDAAIGGAVDAAARPPAVEAPAFALPLVERGVEHLGVAGIEGKVGGAGVFIPVQDLPPGPAAVGGFEDAALGVGTPEVADGGHVDGIGVGGVDDDAADVVGVLEAHVLPVAAAVGGLVYAVAPGRALAVVGLAAAGP